MTLRFDDTCCQAVLCYKCNVRTEGYFRIALRFDTVQIQIIPGTKEWYCAVNCIAYNYEDPFFCEVGSHLQQRSSTNCQVSVGIVEGHHMKWRSAFIYCIAFVMLSTPAPCNFLSVSTDTPTRRLIRGCIANKLVLYIIVCACVCVSRRRQRYSTRLPMVQCSVAIQVGCSTVYSTVLLHCPSVKF